MPTAIITGTPLDCTYCLEDYCGNNTGKTNPGFNAWWVKKHCTYNGSVDEFLLYYPYFVLMIATSLFAIEKLFQSLMKGNMYLEKFYSLLVKEKIIGNADDGGDENVADERIEKIYNILLKNKIEDLIDKNTEPNETNKLNDLLHDEDAFRKRKAAEAEQKKRTAIELEIIEFQQYMQKGKGYFWSCVLRNLLENIFALLLLGYMLLRGFPILNEYTHNDEHKQIKCDVNGYMYECVGIPIKFYIYSLIATCILTLLYTFFNIYNFLWLFIPYFGKLSRVMTRYKNNMLLKAKKNKTGMRDEDVLGELCNIYYNNRDMKLLLDLLATSSGVAPAILILTLFDKVRKNFVFHIKTNGAIHYYNIYFSFF